MIYTTNEGYISLPGNWQDQSMNALLPVLSDVQGANFVISRDQLPPAAEFKDYLATQKKKFSRELTGYKATIAQPCLIDGRDAEYWEFSWKQEAVILWQLVLVIHNDTQVLTLTYTSPNRLPDDAKQLIRGGMLQFKFGLPSADQVKHSKEK